MLMSGDCWQQWLCLDSTNKYNISRTTLPIKLSSCIKLLLKANVQFATSQNECELRYYCCWHLSAPDSVYLTVIVWFSLIVYPVSLSLASQKYLYQFWLSFYTLSLRLSRWSCRLQGVSGSTSFHLVVATTGGQLEPNLVARTPHGLAIDLHNVHMLPPTF